jgi:hypothetical protein
VFSAIAGWVNDKVIKPVTGFFKNLWDGFINGAKNAWNGVMGVFRKVGEFFSGVFNTVKDKILAVFSAGGKVFAGIKDGIINVFKTVVNGIINGINTVIALPFKGLNSILDTIHNVEIVGIRPFDWLTWRAPVPQIPLLAQGGVLERGQVGLLEGNGAEAVVPLEKNREWIQEVAAEFARQIDGLSFDRPNTPDPASNSGLLGRLDKILNAIERGQILTIDGDALVGATVDRMDASLGYRRELVARGAL